MFDRTPYSTLTSVVVTIWTLIASGVCGQPGERSSPAPTQDATILFDGSNQDAWLSQEYKKWEESDGPADWTIVDGGVLEVVSNAGSLITRQKFGDFTL